MYSCLRALKTSTELRPYAGYLGLLAASEVFEGGFDVLMLASFAGGFDVLMLASFEDKSGCRILDLLGFVKKMFWKT